MIPSIRTLSLELAELATTYQNSTIFKQYEKTKAMIDKVTKLQKYATPDLSEETSDVIIYACQLADSAMSGRKVDPTVAMVKLYKLLGKMQADLT